jgi:Family of unknown function (DUF6263)
MKKIFSITAMLMLLGVASLFYSCQSSKSAAGKVLKFNLEKGKGYNYEIVWDMATKAMGNETKISLLGNYSMQVTEDDGHVKSMTGTYESFKMNIKMGEMVIDVDTDKPSPVLTEEELKTNPLGMIGRMFAGIKGKSFTMKVDEEGKVLEVNGFEKIVTGMIDSIGAPEEARAQIQASLKDQFNDDMIKDQFAQAFTIFPNKEVKVGDTWQKTVSVRGKTPSNFITDYTVKAIDGDHVTLDSKTKITSGSGEMDLSGNQTGTLLVDSKSGLVIDASFNQDIKVKAQGVDVDTMGKGRIKGKAI